MSEQRDTQNMRLRRSMALFAGALLAQCHDSHAFSYTTTSSHSRVGVVRPRSGLGLHFNTNVNAARTRARTRTQTVNINSNSNRKNNHVRTRMSTIDDTSQGPGQGQEYEQEYEDVDGIGELTAAVIVASTTGPPPVAVASTSASEIGIEVQKMQDVPVQMPIAAVSAAAAVTGTGTGTGTGTPSVPEDIDIDMDLVDSIVDSLPPTSAAVTVTNTGSGTSESVPDELQKIIASALTDPDVHGSIPTENIKQEVQAFENKENKKLSMSLSLSDYIESPRLSKIIKFAIPAIGVWLCSPLLSLIDTSSVGLLSGTAQQAALNPAVAVTDYSALLASFMYTATTNLVASVRESEKDMVKKPKTTKTLIQSMQLSGFVGLLIGCVLCSLAPILLKAIIGNDSIDPEVFSAALRYVRIRALGCPAAVIIGSTQSACLGLQDIKSPMYVLLAAAVVNFAGDMIFVPRASAWVGGAAGAAWATVFSQYAALGLFLRWLRSSPSGSESESSPKFKFMSRFGSKARRQKNKSGNDNGGGGDKPVNITKAILELTGEGSEGKPRRKQFRKSLETLSVGAAATPSVSASGTTGSSDSSISASTSASASLTMEETSDSSNSQGDENVKSVNLNMDAKGITAQTMTKPRPFASFFDKVRSKRNERKSKSAAASASPDASFSTRGFLAGKMRNRDLVKFPPLNDAKKFWPYVVPVTTTSVGRVSAYVAMTHVVSSTLGPLSMAANQVILSVFYCLTPVCDSLNLTAQSFLPGIVQQKGSSGAKADAMSRSVRNFVKASIIFGGACVGMVGLVPYISRFFTSDPLVIAQVNSVVPILAGIFALHGFICTAEGILLGQRDLGFLGKSYASYFFAVPYFMLRLKRLAFSGVSIGLSSLWEVFFFYQIVRASMFGARIIQLNRFARKAQPEPQLAPETA